MERETKTVTTPLGKELVLKAVLNMRERNAVLGAFKDGGIGADTSGMDAALAVMSVAPQIFAQVVVSYDGSAEKIYERLEDLDAAEFDFVLKESAEVTTGNLEKAN